jgi:hypothetical protein
MVAPKRGETEMSELRDLRQLLETAAYHPQEIERILDPANPAFIEFDPVLGYVLRDYNFNDGDGGIICDYVYEPRGGHRKMINYADRPCRINTYGNSYTQCAQVSLGETWQEILAAHFHEPIRNFGVGGYGVYQAYRRCLRTEVEPDLAADNIILNVWDDDHKRNLDAARWIRVAWMCRDLPRGGKDTYPVHGFPWAHMRYDLDKGTFIELPGFCEKAEDLRKLVGKENYYNVFKDDHVAHLCALTEGGDAPVDALEPIAEAFGLKVNLRDPATRTADAKALHLAYGMRSTMWIVDHLRDWAKANGRNLMVMLSYDVPTVTAYLEKGERWDNEMLAYLDGSGVPYVDALAKAGEEYKAFNIPIEQFLARHYVGRAGAQVFGHYNPYGNFWFAHAVKNEMVEWLDPKPPSYR